MTERTQLPTRFRPLRRPSHLRRALALLIAPLLWFVALDVLAFVVDRADAVWDALIVVGASFVLGLLLSLWMRAARIREERDA